MTLLSTPAVQVLLFVLGCLAIHAARGHAAALARVLTGTALVLVVVLMIAAALDEAHAGMFVGFAGYAML